MPNLVQCRDDPEAIFKQSVCAWPRYQRTCSKVCLSSPNPRVSVICAQFRAVRLFWKHSIARYR